MKNTDKKSLTLKTLNKSNIWDVHESDIFRMLQAAEKDADIKDNYRHYIDIIKSAFDMEEVKADRPEVVKKYEERGYKVSTLRTPDGQETTTAVKKRPITRVTDLTYENIRHISAEKLMQVIDRFPGLVVLDEAYIDFSAQESFTKVLAGCPNLVVLQTFSKAWASAGVRLGMAFASAEVIGTFNKIKYPYNVNRLTQEYALELLRRRQDDVKGWVEILLRERGRLMDLFAKLPVVREIYPTDANFFLAKMTDAAAIYRYLVEAGIIVRNRSGVALCADCLRVTVGTPEEDDILLEALRNYTER